ncbi:MAG: hypothetical protein HY862_21905 [Chloroflexi bacterium]|nr:hypothetical protein [Chloroflexota bacterium]
MNRINHILKVLPILTLVCLLSVTAFLPAPSAVHAQTPLDVVLQRVKDFFAQQLGRNFTLVNYTYQLNTWQDSSLGCPKAGVSYTQGELQGYIWQFTIDQDTTTYELHSDTDGNVVVLCTPINRTVAIGFRSYQNTAFIIDYPETWQVVPSEDLSDVIISPDGTKNCANPIIEIQHKTAIGNADLLLNEVIREAGFVEDLQAPSAIGASTALSATYKAVCGEVVHQFRTTAIPLGVEGDGYIILQSAPLDQYEGWSANFLSILDSFEIATSQTTADGTVVTPPPTGDTTQLLAGYPFAHVFANDVYLGSYVYLPGYGVTNNARRDRRGLSFSPNGQYLAYIELLENGNQRLEVSDTGKRSEILANPVAPDFPAAWSVTGERIAFLTPTDQEGTLTVNTALPTGEDLQTLGTIPFTIGCEDETSPYAAERLYQRETGPFGNTFGLEWLPDNRFLYTTSCAGEGLAIWNPADNTSLNLGSDLSRAVVSPDHQQLLAMAGDQTVLVNLTNGERTEIAMFEVADQLAWANNTQFYYTTITPSGAPFEISDPAVQERAEEQLGIFPYESVLNTVSIVQYDLSSGTATPLWQGQGYAIGKLAVAPNQAGIVFSLIPSDRDMVLGFVQELDTTQLRFAMPETKLYFLTRGATDPRLIVVSSQPVFGQAIPPAAPPQPPQLP